DMGEIEGANQADPGDVLVIQGLAGVSAMGGLMSAMAKRQGAIGAVVDGGIRDLGRARSLDFPIWSSEVTPVTGKWRSEVVEINGAVSIAGLVVRPGDLVVADETGVAFVPAELAPDVVERVEAIAAAEDGYVAALAGDLPLPELIKAHRGKGPQ
ncbi:MAG: RraA family protein, partial [Solirubrobacterales bacterium]|nr:RraA family protein [Solirubrobacterales bacterium]